MFEQGQPLVRSIAMSIARRLPIRIDVDDLIGYGQLGLAEAVIRYEKSPHNQFTTFAYYRIKGAMFDGIAKMTWTSRSRLNRLRHERAEREETGASADDEERSAERLARIHLTGRYDPGTAASSEGLTDETLRSPVNVVVDREVASKLREMVVALPRPARILIESVYFEGITLHQAAKRLGISKSWASRLHARTLQQLASSLRHMGVD